LYDVHAEGKESVCLQALVPITEEMNVPYDLHRFIIGTKGRDVRKMMEDNDVNISIPPGQHSRQIFALYNMAT
jgi:polyribonucleotide nucleotidyltransferase